MILHPRARPYTAFTVMGMGQFQWVTSPMGLLGCLASFQHLMETVVNSISNVILYIDNLLVHSATPEEHLATLNQVLNRLVQHHIKINFQKCIIWSKEVSYLGFWLTKEGIKPGTDKLKVVKNAPLPYSVHEVLQFLGLCNFFGGHVRNFAQLTSVILIFYNGRSCSKPDATSSSASSGSTCGWTEWPTTAATAASAVSAATAGRSGQPTHQQCAHRASTSGPRHGWRYGRQVQQTKLPEFWGQKDKHSITAKEYVKRVDKMMSANNWSDKIAFDNFGLALSGSANTWLDSQITLKKISGDQEWWTIIQPFFKEEFATESEDKLTLDGLPHTAMHPNENIRDFMRHHEEHIQCYCIHRWFARAHHYSWRTFENPRTSTCTTTFTQPKNQSGQMFFRKQRGLQSRIHTNSGWH